MENIVILEKQICCFCKEEFDKKSFRRNGRNYKSCLECYTKYYTERNEKMKEKKQNNMIEINGVLYKKNKCKECGKRAIFNFEGLDYGIFCKTHKDEKMINIKEKRKCIEPNCKKRPTFNYEDEKKAIYCFEHKLDNMINVKDKRCIEPNCKKQPTFNYKDEKKALYCKTHMKQGMIDIRNKNKICKEDNCNSRSSYNFETETTAIYCAKHRKPGMVDIVHRRCQEPNCYKNPNFNYENEIKPIFCKTHAKPDMIDVIHKICDHKDCKTRSSYGFPSNSPNKCFSHKQDGMILNPTRKCIYNLCQQIAIYGIKETIHCENHKQENEICLIERNCKICNRLDVVNQEGVCMNFCLLEEKYNIYKKNIKTKELRILEICKEKFGEPDLYDKVIDSNCSKSRPDIVYDMKTHIVIIEIDENQHRDGNNYNLECEYTRMINIFNSFGGTSICFIRYNPDNFKKKGKIIEIDNSKKEKTLMKWIKKARNNIPEKMCSVLYLFYDEYEKENLKFFKINPYKLKKYSCDNCDFITFIKGIYKRHEC